MKKLLLSSLFACLAIAATGQTTTEILASREIKMPVYKSMIPSAKQLYLPTEFGKSLFENQAEVKALKNVLVASVDIVFSDFPAGKDFLALNRKRIENLKRLNPKLFKDKNIQWNLVRQTRCPDENAAKKLFHGVVIAYRPTQSEETIREEIKFLENLFSGKTPEIVIPDEIKKESLILPAKESRLVILNPMITGYRPVAPDSTVMAVLRRQKWTNMLITADLTGSMSPYTAQLFLWLKLQTTKDKVKQFVFFNDGNRTLDHQKIIGNTGGIYDTRSAKFEDIQQLAIKTMQNGSGGDAAENDIESLLKGIALCPECKDIILIADNWAPIKDIELMSKIKKPVKIVLCGADYGINPQYLDLARTTGGSVHTMRDDLTELVKLNEGQEFTVRGQTFRIVDGNFVRIVKI